MSQESAQHPLILVVEDSEPSRKVVASILTKLNYRVVTVVDGVSALQFLKDSDDKPILILSDIMMPNMNGIDFLREAKKLDKTKGIKFVFTTAAQEKEYVVEAKNLKVDGYILKPLTFDRVQKKILELFPEQAKSKFIKIA